MTALHEAAASGRPLVVRVLLEGRADVEATTREGETTPAPHVAAIFDLARRVCDVPRDFEAQHKYGPKSGICHEERVANAYLAGMLEGGDEELRRSLKRLVDRREYAEAVELCAAN